MRERKRGTVRDLRRENRAAVLWSLYLGKARTRQEVSAATGLSAASVTSVVRELLDEGMVIEAGQLESDGGRPRALLGMNAGYGYVIGVDVGETRTRVGLFDLTMTQRAMAEYPLDGREHEVDAVVTQILDGIDAVIADGGVDQSAVLGVGIGVPGAVQQQPEVLVHGQTYGWDAVPLKRLLSASTDLSLYIDNGAKTMGQAEMWFGAGRGASRAVTLLVGSGIGAALVLGQAADRNVTVSAAEVGHIVVAVGGRRCRCGATGCLEAYAGAEAILERYGRPVPAADQEAALAELIDAAGSSPFAATILSETAEYLGAGIGSLINLLAPDRVILGGWAGLRLGGQLLAEIRESARQHSLRQPFAGTAIELGALGAGGVALGAATLPVESLLNGVLQPGRRMADGPSRTIWSPPGSGHVHDELPDGATV
jgi:predicted NBD/HSP70 family sugar kinase